MIALRVLQLILWLFVIPAGAGSLFFLGKESPGNGFAGPGRAVFAWVGGQILLWAVFQLLCVPVILRQGNYSLVQRLYLAAVAVLLCSAGLAALARRKKPRLRLVEGFGKGDRASVILWVIFWALLLFQIVQAIRLTYADGDDAFYVAVSTITADADTMYSKLPYTGETTWLDVRHGLAPFPIWITFLSKMSGFKPVSIAHLVVSPVLIAMAYGVFYLTGRKINGRHSEKLPLFLVFVEILVLFGDYSYYTVENFMLARSRQGKAALGSIIIPALFFLLLQLLEYLKEKKKIPPAYWGLLAAAMTAGALCSTMGAMLCCMLVGIGTFCAAVGFRRWKILFPAAFCCLPCAAYALLYLRMG